MRCRWHGSSQELIDGTGHAQIDRLVERLSFGRVGRSHTRGESGSWAQSLPEVGKVLAEAGLKRLRVILEYNPYQAGEARVDVIIAGVGVDGRPTYIVLEIKQWSSATRDPRDGRVRGTGAPYEGPEGLSDPFEQASDYARFIRNYTKGLHDENLINIWAAAYLHNGTADSVQSLLSTSWEQERAVFVGGLAGRRAFADQLNLWFRASGAHEDVADLLLTAGYQQAPKLLSVAGEILTNPDRYPLSDEQREIYAQVLHSIQEALLPSADRSQALITIKGGPGTGKTWIAMHLLGANARAGRQVSYATNSASLRTALARRARDGLRQIDLPVGALITSARTYWDEQRWKDPLDVLLVDEAQRIAAYTVRRGHANPEAVQTALEARQITQLFELKRSAKVLVVFIDEDQSITPKDDCSAIGLKSMAVRTGASYQEFVLTEQHRSGGSDHYESWVDALLAGAPVVWRDQENYQVALVDTPVELEMRTCDPNAAGYVDGARLLAGFCWPWEKWPDSPSSIDDIPYDIQIDGWCKRWNLRHRIDGYPEDSSWASVTEGSEQVGSVFTAQGFEFGRCGVILGPDFRFDPASDSWQVDPSKTHYAALARAVRSASEYEDLIRNHYRVLLTRAMAATVIYSTDPATRAKLAELVNP